MTATLRTRRRGVFLLLSVFAFVAALAAPKAALAATPKFGVKDISISRTKARKGQTVTYKVKAKNADLVIVAISYRKGSTYQYLSQSATKQKNTFTAKFKVFDGMAPGAWKLSAVYAFGKDNKSTTISNKDDYLGGTKKADLSKFGFKVSGTKADTKAPSAKPSTLKLAKKSVRAYKPLSVSISAKDNLSGVNSITMLFADKNGNTEWTGFGFPNKPKGLCKGSLYFTKPGTYGLVGIFIYDKVGNEQSYMDPKYKNKKDVNGSAFSDMFYKPKTADFSKYRVTVKK